MRRVSVKPERLSDGVVAVLASTFFLRYYVVTRQERDAKRVPYILAFNPGR